MSSAKLICVEFYPLTSPITIAGDRTVRWAKSLHAAKQGPSLGKHPQRSPPNLCVEGYTTFTALLHDKFLRPTAPRIHGELLKLGIEVSQATVGRYLPRRPKAPSPTWRSFLRNHMTVIAAVDMFMVATVTFKLLYAVIVLSHHRRRVIHFEVTQNPTQAWLARQITEAFSWDTAPRYLLRDRDTSYGICFHNRARAMGIEEVLTAPRSPWQNPYVERIVGSIRRDCLDHVIIFNETHLRRVLSCYFRYYHRSRTHLSLNKDCPDPRLIQPVWHALLAAAWHCHEQFGHSYSAV